MLNYRAIISNSETSVMAKYSPATVLTAKNNSYNPLHKLEMATLYVGIQNTTHKAADISFESVISV